MNLVAELKEVKGIKSASLDMIYTIRLLTDDSSVLELGKLPADTLFKVTIEPEGA